MMHHHHSSKHIKQISNRLAKTIGHLEAIKKMVESDKDCSEILIQLSAVKSAVNNTATAILKEHLSHCLIHALEENDHKSLEDLHKAIDMFVK
ncbi:metal-sensing transcriptional repressor [Campylobacter upsaliensis]|nr:metal-sensing transcriptional repressor [Campylobacter upsaliensis]